MNRIDGTGEAELTERYDAFRAARARSAAVHLSAFLPSGNHPDFRRIRCELLRLDLEWAWREGKRRLVLDYIGIFPDLLEDRATIEALAVTEYRLRAQAGEDPAPAEYEWQYGVKITDAPLQDSQPRGAVASPASEEEASTSIVPSLESPASDGSGNELEASGWIDEAINALPAVGTQFLTFQLIAELGRGGFGRVYLARQGDLADRLVALKITIDLPGEEQKLAQMQHTNVVPIYSFHQAENLHAVCMPFFGATTLADIVRGLQIHARPPESGQVLVNIVNARRNNFLDRSRLLTPAAAASPARVRPQPHGLPQESEDGDAPVTLSLLEETTYVEAILWLAERLTEGLSHAHEHGILHRDLKPANILLTDDGQPMLLDFNLSTDAKLDSSLIERRVGGTLPYMAPEHLASLTGGAAAVDERSDVYALGVILYQLLAGRLPFASPSRPVAADVPAMIATRSEPLPSVRRWNPAVSFSVESIIHHCLHADPRARYQSARQLREDLKRHRQQRPLRHAAEPSPRERLQKWVRRHPRLVSPASLGAITACVLLLALAPSAWQTYQDWEKQQEAQEKQKEAQQQIRLQAAVAKEAESARAVIERKDKAQQKYRAFRASLGSARAVMESVNAVQMMPRFMKPWACEEARLRDHMAKCQSSLQWYDVLQEPKWSEQQLVNDLPREEQVQLRLEVTELLYALAEAEQVQAAHQHEQARDFALIPIALTLPGVGREIWDAWQAVAQGSPHFAQLLNKRACACWAENAMPRALLLQQAQLLQRLGQDAQAAQITKQAEKLSISTKTEDAYWTASILAAKGDHKQALALLEQALARAPDHYGACLLRGLCLTPRFSVASLRLDQTGRQKALECFTTCVVMRPNEMWGYYHRGLVSYHVNLTENALADFDRILRKEVLDKHPDFATAYVPRATVRFDLGKYEDAEKDLSRAIEFEANVPEYYFLRAKVREKRNDQAGARRDEQKVLSMTPSSAEGWIYRGLVRSPKDPQGALVDFEEALAVDATDPLAHFVKGRLLAQDLKRPREAVLALDRALLIKPDFNEARITRALANAALGERSKALNDIDLLLENDPSPPMHYQAARVYTLTSRQNADDVAYALGTLAYALRHGYGVQTYRQDPDLAPLRKRPEFERLGMGLKYLGAPP